jgi:acylphosphatase
MLARRYILKGRVQGVGFRYFTCRVARDLRIKGWVKNLQNGEVEIHAESDSETMTRFLERIKSGPSFAFVEDVEVSEVPPENYPDFSIER